MKTLVLTSSIFILTYCPHLISAQTITFQLAPTLNQRSIETEERIITTTNSAESTTQIEHQSSITERSFQKTTNGFYFIENIKSMIGERDGKPDGNLMCKVFVAVTTTNVLSNDGHCLQLLWADQMLVEAKKIFPERLHSQLEANMIPSVLEKVAKTRWEDTVSLFVGQTIKMGIFGAIEYHLGIQTCFLNTLFKTLNIQSLII